MTIKPMFALIVYAMLTLAAGVLVGRGSELYFLPAVFSCVPAYIVVDAINEEDRK